MSDSKRALIGAGLVVLGFMLVLLCVPGQAVEELIFVNVPSGTTEEDIVKFQPILDHVADVAGVEIKYIVATDYSAVIQAMMFGHADMARVGPFEYVQARELFGAIPIACDVKSNTGTPFYYSFILARADLGLEDFAPEDLKGLNIAYVDPTSTSGYLVPKTMLVEIGLQDTDFNEIYFAGSHASAIIAFAQGMVDIACTNEFRYLKAIASGVITEDDVTIIMRSDPIPSNPVIIRPGLGEELVARLMVAWLTVPPEAAAPFKLDGFAVTLDERYDPIRDIAAALLP